MGFKTGISPTALESKGFVSIALLLPQLCRHLALLQTSVSAMECPWTSGAASYLQPWNEVAAWRILGFFPVEPVIYVGVTSEVTEVTSEGLRTCLQK